jgi:hypothetical protein
MAKHNNERMKNNRFMAAKLEKKIQTRKEFAGINTSLDFFQPSLSPLS